MRENLDDQQFQEFKKLLERFLKNEVDLNKDEDSKKKEKDSQKILWNLHSLK